MKKQCPWTQWIGFDISKEGVKVNGIETSPEYLIPQSINWSGKVFDIYRDKNLSVTQDVSINYIKNIINLWLRYKIDISDKIMKKTLFVRYIPNYPTKLGFFSCIQEKTTGINLYRTPNMNTTYVTDVKNAFDKTFDINEDSVCVGPVTDKVIGFRGSPEDIEGANSTRLTYLRKCSKARRIQTTIKLKNDRCIKKWTHISRRYVNYIDKIKSLYNVQKTLKRVFYMFKLKKLYLINFYIRLILKRTQPQLYNISSEKKRLMMKEETLKLLRENKFNTVLSNNYTLIIVLYPNIYVVSLVINSINLWKREIVKRREVFMMNERVTKNVARLCVKKWAQRIKFTNEILTMELVNKYCVMKHFINVWKHETISESGYDMVGDC